MQKVEYRNGTKRRQTRSGWFVCTIEYCIAGYIGRNNVWRFARKIAIGGYKFGGYSTIATAFPGVYAVGAILADLILAV